MSVRTLLLGAVAAGLASTLASPADARFDIGIGSVLGNTGIHTGVNYRLGGWNDRFGSHVYIDAGRYINRCKKRDRRADEERERKDGRREARRPSGDVRLSVSPGASWVYLNGVRLDVDGRSKLVLPEGRHRLEFVRPGYRTEVAELSVQPGIRYKVERKLTRLQEGELADPRIDSPGAPVALETALRSRGTFERADDRPDRSEREPVKKSEPLRR